MRHSHAHQQVAGLPPIEAERKAQPGHDAPFILDECCCLIEDWLRRNVFLNLSDVVWFVRTALVL